MSGNQLNGPTIPAMSRRRFIAGVGTAIAGGSLLGVVSGCGSGVIDLTGPGSSGTLRGTVVDAAGLLQPVGRIYLLQKNGFNAGNYRDVDSAGRFEFANVDVGDYQLRFWGGNLASVREPLPNPVPVRVAAAVTMTVQFTVAIGREYDGPEQEIYLGEYYFQQQPVGDLNGTTTVKLGTLVCWYNVGDMVHDVSGGPWVTSGPIQRGGNFMWLADQLGTFPYRCSYHGTQMLATLKVVS